MKLRVLIPIGLLVIGLLAGVQQATAFTVSGAGASANGTVGMLMTLTQSVQLTVVGANHPTENNTTVGAGGGGRDGDIDFGSVNSISATPTNGYFKRKASNNGAYFVATLDATALASGWPGGADVTLCVDEAASTLGGYTAARIRKEVGNTTSWDVGTPGTPLPACTGSPITIDGVKASGTTINHELAIDVNDSDDGSLGQRILVVQYTITGQP